MYLGVKAVITKSFARIHKANLVNFGILPLEFADQTGYDAVQQGDALKFSNVRELIEGGATSIPVQAGSNSFECILDISNRQREIILAGGLLNYTKMMHG